VLSTLLVIGLAIVIIVDCLIRTSRRGLIQIVPEIDIQLLTRAHIPRTRIRPRDTCNSPSQAIALPRERAISVFRLGERDTQAVVVDIARLTHDGVEELFSFARCGNKLNELA
jgi:hypothetical protein